MGLAAARPEKKKKKKTAISSLPPGQAQGIHALKSITEQGGLRGAPRASLSRNAFSSEGGSAGLTALWKDVWGYSLTFKVLGRDLKHRRTPILIVCHNVGLHRIQLLIRGMHNTSITLLEL